MVQQSSSRVTPRHLYARSTTTEARVHTTGSRGRDLQPRLTINNSISNYRPTTLMEALSII